ncbi:hypothetical protein GYMLUDRAFT_218564 [Collybiopsis luxurians FD-317 M1]|nr:hypothetical protein GYMLUDRAFT_218564 [Collybiopsis luxurians FD-317 M1]
MRIAIIGGGPSGLVTLKYLVHAHRVLGKPPVEATLFERETGVGGAFRVRVYEDAELVSSKQLTTFSDFRPFPEDNDFFSVERYIQYLNDYCDYFKLWPYIKLSTPVVSVTRHKGAGHLITYTTPEGPQTWECDAVAVCSGLHTVPNIPSIKGVEHVPKVFHSSEFKVKQQFGEGNTIMILGSGETSADMAYMAITQPTTKSVVMCHRDGFHLAPKRNPHPYVLPSIFGKPERDRPEIPVDVSRASLFDTAYVHPLLRNSMALWIYYDWYVKATLRMVYGTPAGMDQWIGKISDERYYVYQIFLNKSGARIAPYISEPWRPREPFTIGQKIRNFFFALPNRVDTKGKYVDLAPWPERIDENGVVHFIDNGRAEYQRMREKKVKPDVLIYCTGYKQEFPFLKSNVHGSYPVASDANVRGIWKKDDPSVGFFGFIRPSPGAIPPLSEMQAQLWVLALLTPEHIPRELRPEDEPHYRLINSKHARITYGVDHESYTYQLALDMDSAPSFTEVMQIAWKQPHTWWRLPLVWALGANFNTKFRLRGPWAWDGAVEVLTEELWDTVARRNFFFGHITLSFVPMLIFGPMSLAVWFFAKIRRLVVLG